MGRSVTQVRVLFHFFLDKPIKHRLSLALKRLNSLLFLVVNSHFIQFRGHLISRLSSHSEQTSDYTVVFQCPQCVVGIRRSMACQLFHASDSVYLSLYTRALTYHASTLPHYRHVRKYIS